MLDARRFWCDDSERIREVHPEGSFRAIAQVPIPSKKRWIGLTTRLRLLAREGLDALALPGVPDEAGIDDLLDAVVAAWSAHRIASGQARCLPDPPERDADGRAVAIWY
jgi:predicted RNase H-like nuclease